MSTRPDRSDARPSPEAEVREYFDGAAPKRHTKPSRSEHSAVYADAGGNSHPELDKFQELEACTEVSVHPLHAFCPKKCLNCEQL
jgi:hypothetical protein